MMARRRLYGIFDIVEPLGISQTGGQARGDLAWSLDESTLAGCSSTADLLPGDATTGGHVHAVNMAHEHRDRGPARRAARGRKIFDDDAAASDEAPLLGTRPPPTSTDGPPRPCWTASRLFPPVLARRGSGSAGGLTMDAAAHLRAHEMDSMTLGRSRRACASGTDHLRAIGRPESPGTKRWWP